MIQYPDRRVTGWPRSAPLRWADAACHIPSDKSISHRALLFAGLSDHPVVLRGVNRGAAVRLLVSAMTALGLQIEAPDAGTLIVRRGFRQRTIGPVVTVDLGPSSAAARLLIGVACGAGIACVVDGDDTLRDRPFDWIVEPLAALGAALEYVARPGRLPIRIVPAAFRGGETRTSIGSAQSVSAVLFAGIAARREVAIDYPVLSRDHTQQMAARFGEIIHDVPRSDGGGVVRYAPRTLQVPATLTIPRDPSALAYIAALFWLRSREQPEATLRIDDVCINPTRLGFFRWMERCGFRCAIEPRGSQSGELVGAVVLAGGGTPHAVDLGAKAELHAMIDEIPLAVAIACLLPGRAAFRDLYELTFKETDRIAATRQMLAHFGLAVTVERYDILVTGDQVPAPAAVVPSFGDHRLAMTAHVLLHACAQTATIAEGGCFATSFPSFAACLDAINPGSCDG